MSPETRIAVESHALRLMDRIAVEPDQENRLLMFQMLEKACADIGMDLPNRKRLEGLVAADTRKQDTASVILAAFRALDDMGLPYNHSRNEQEVAVQFSHLQHLAWSNSIALPSKTAFTRAMKGQLGAENKTINSTIEGFSIRCWVIPRKLAG